MDINELMCRALCRADGGNPDAETTRQHMPYKKLWECYRPQINDIRAALEAAGYAIVPRKPTKAMDEAGYDAIERDHEHLDVWEDMIAASEEPE